MKLDGKNKNLFKTRDTDITGPGLLSLVELGGGVILKIEVFVTYKRVTRS